jgi:hypothetical protein
VPPCKGISAKIGRCLCPHGKCVLHGMKAPTGELHFYIASPDTASNGKPAVAVVELGRGPFDSEETG